MVTTLDDVPDKNASGLWELKSCHPRWMEASVTTCSSILLKTCRQYSRHFSPELELLQLIKKRGQKTRTLRMLISVWTVSP